ncbi:facilitated trehalose transporter Tret1-like isoform X2 [Anoplophora glabripennis]|nr:facilitated trehalose transporter Tret1-like isoform X2 [Anoplophora glabripennis]
MSGAITQPLGRKRAMQLVNIPFLTAWLLFHFSEEPWQIFLALSITGVSGGLLEAPVLTYVAEITQPHLRGILSSTSSMAVMLGILSQFLLGALLRWRTIVLINCAVPILSFVLLIFVPETPIWLISKKKFDEARKSIAWLRGWVPVQNVENEFQELCKQRLQEETRHVKSELTEDLTNKMDGTKKPSNIENLKLYSTKQFLWPYFVVSLVFFLSHFNGNTTLQIYAIKIFSTLKTPIDKYYATVILGIVQFLGCIICVVFVNILGKRTINFISLLGSGICFIVVATYAYFIDVKYFEDTVKINGTSNATHESTFNEVPIQDFRWIPVTFLVASAFLSYVGIKILPWILTGEVYFSKVRATASGISGGTGYIFSFLANKIFLSMVSCFTLPGVFWFYGTVSVVGTILLYFLLPETEGKSLFEITEHFAGRNNLTNSVRRKKIQHSSGKNNEAFEPDIHNGHVESRL